MKIPQKSFGGKILTILLFLIIAGCNTKSEKRVTICSKDFTEQAILAEILAQHIEAKTDLKVDKKLNLGGSLCHQSLTSGQIDLYVEYTGTAFTNILKQKPIADREKIWAYLQQEYPKQFKAEWTAPLGFNNTFAITIRGEDAKKFNLETITQLGKVSQQFRAGFGPEFQQREDGFPGLAKTYGLKFGEAPKEMMLGLLYQALKEKQVDVIAGASTDGLIDSLGLVVLKDDKQYFPPYNAAPVVRKEVLEKYPQLRSALEELGGKISEVDMRKMNFQVDGNKREATEVAREFLKQKFPTK
jgi:glycine betaine/choline ABC-type transport system substrate-binding protein